MRSVSILMLALLLAPALAGAPGAAADHPLPCPGPVADVPPMPVGAPDLPYDSIEQIVRDRWPATAGPLGACAAHAGAGAPTDCFHDGRSAGDALTASASAGPAAATVPGGYACEQTLTGTGDPSACDAGGGGMRREGVLSVFAAEWNSSVDYSSVCEPVIGYRAVEVRWDGRDPYWDARWVGFQIWWYEYEGRCRIGYIAIVAGTGISPEYDCGPISYAGVNPVMLPTLP